MLSQPLKGVHEPLIGLFPTYCFDMDKTIYEVGYEFGDTAFLSGATGMFQSRYISLKVSIIVDKLTLATGAIDELKTIPTLDSGLFTPPPEAMHINMHPVQIEPHIAAGSIIKKVVPIYPALAVQARMEGTVILHAIIGREGRIHSLRIDTPSSTELTISAIAAVRQWTYKPYLINGEPTEVDTTITVNFRR
jgi:TonB family protein